MFREHGCELPCKRHVRAHEYAISISHPMHVLSSELRKPIEKSVCLAILFAPSLILRVGGKQWDIAAAKRCPPNLPALSRRRNWKLVLIVPAEDELARKTSQPLGHRRSHLWFSFICHNGSPTKNSWLAKTKSRRGDFMQNGSIMRSTRLRGPDVWEFRWREAGADGKRKHRRMVIGSIAQFSDKSSALLEVGAPLWKINLNHPHLSPRAVTISELVSHYRQRELATDHTWKTHSTKVTYQGYLNK